MGKIDFVQDTLDKIFGPEWPHLSKKERKAAKRVVEYYIGKRQHESVKKADSTQMLLSACHYALAEEGWDWDSIMLTKTRRKEIVNLRYAVFSIFWSQTNIPQVKRVELLGGRFNRTTILRAALQSDNWRECDIEYREMFDRISRSVQEYLNSYSR